MDANKKHEEIYTYARKTVRNKARQLMGKGGLTLDDIEDVQADMTLDILSRLPKLDLTKGTFKTFIMRLVERRISQIFRHRTQEKRDFRRKDGSLNDLIEDTEGGLTERWNTISEDDADIRRGKRDRIREEQEQIKLDVSFVIPKLPDDLREVVADLLVTGTIAETARNLGIPRPTLYGALERIRRIFTEKDLQDYF